MPQVDGAVIKTRAARLREIGRAALARHLQSYVGTTAEVLVERGQQGHSAHYAPVRAVTAHTPGEIVSMRITGADAETLIGEAIL